MKFYPLPDGSQLPALGLGTWRMGGGTVPDTSQDSRVLHALRYALEIGYRHIDTAEMYAAGHTEELVGRALRESGVPRAEVFLTSKVWHTHLRYQEVVRACEDSLRRLQTDYLDLYLIHWPSSDVPLEETFRALNDLVRQAKIRFVGVSNFDVPLLQKAVSLCETPLLTNQVPYSLHNRTYQRNGVLSFCRENGLLLTAYTPLEKGHLAQDDVLETIAARRGVKPAQVALAWLLNQPGVVTIPKTLSPVHLEENLAAAEMQLSEEEMRLLNALE